MRAFLLTILLVAAVLAGCMAKPAVDTGSCVDCPPVDPVVELCPDGTEVPAGAACPGLEPAPVLPWHPSDGAAEVVDMLLPGAGEHMVPTTVYRPLVSGPNATVPVLLHSHGWAGTRTSDPAAFQPFVAAGFGVVSIDMRGHGAAAGTSEARVHGMAHEIPDVQAVVDTVATWDWVHLDAPGDPRIGAMGGSYGGGYQLLLAAVDDRVDSLAPEITWNDLLRSLAPDGAPKSAWVDLLYWGAAASGTTLAQDIHQAYLWLEATNAVPDGSLPGQVDIVTPFTESSPATHAGKVRVPTLLVQGAPDTLFSFNEAVANHDMIRATGAPVSLVTHLRGHILNTDGTLPDSPAGQPIGLQPPQGDDPCGDTAGLVLAWHMRHLIGIDMETGPAVCLALEDGGTLTGDTFPLPGTVTETVDLGALTIAVGPRGLPVETTLVAADASAPMTYVAGIPRLRASWEAPTDSIVYWTLEKVAPDGARHVVLSQVTPTRLEGEGTLELDLLGVAVALEPGSSLVLVAADRNAQYLHNDSRTPGVVSLSDVQVDIPVLVQS